MIIIGLTGVIGAGKGTVVEYLIETYGYSHFSARTLITEEIEKRGLAINRDNMALVANDLRATHSPSYLIESLYKRAAEQGKDCIIEAIRTPGEIEALRKIGHFYLLAVTADLPIRYERVILRNSKTDDISFEKFVEQNDSESKSTDPHKINMNACVAMADFVLTNNGTVEELYVQIEEVFGKIGK